MSNKVSIIIPCFNIELHISKCVDSILQQTYQDFEILLIDDGSADNTLEVCREYEEKDSRIKVHTHSNKGVSYTRNRGIELAQNELLVFIDGDDFIKEGYIERLVKGYEEGAWTICGMINVRAGVEKENENFYRLLNQFPEGVINKEEFLYLLKFYSYSSPCARIYSKSIIAENKIVFPEDISYQEDLIFNMEYSKYIERVYLLDYFGYYYMEHSVSSTGRYHHNFDHIDLLYFQLKEIIKSGDKEETILKRFIFDTILKKLSNDFHADSVLSDKQKLQKISILIQTSSYQYIQDYIWKSPINFIYKIVLFSNNKRLIFNYLKLVIK